MNEMGTIVHDFSAPYVEKAGKRSKRQGRKKRDAGIKYVNQRTKGMFEINKNWNKCYAGW